MRKSVVIFFLLPWLKTAAQNERLNDFNNISWLQTFNTIRLDKKWSLHLEYQWRREKGLKYWQQSLLRIGANYKLNDNVTAHLGYGWIETFPYGDFPIASAGTFPEHRIYEQITLRQPVKRWSFSHRFRTEQRWLGRVKSNSGRNREIESWSFLHRFRYQFRVLYPLASRSVKLPYVVAADEIFIGAGKNVGVNIFDQNRIFLLFGYQLNKTFSFETGYFNQTLQQGRRVNNSTIVQRNNGIVFSSFFNL